MFLHFALKSLRKTEENEIKELISHNPKTTVGTVEYSQMLSQLFIHYWLAHSPFHYNDCSDFYDSLQVPHFTLKPGLPQGSA